MKTIIATAATLAWGLWFGGVISLFIFVQKLFSIDHDLGAQAAPHLFMLFARYQIGLAAAALVATFFWRQATPSRSVTALFILLTIAFAGALFSGYYVTPHLEELRLSAQIHDPQFRRLHAMSMVTYMTEAAALLFAGCTLPTGLTQTTNSRR